MSYRPEFSLGDGNRPGLVQLRRSQQVASEPTSSSRPSRRGPGAQLQQVQQLQPARAWPAGAASGSGASGLQVQRAYLEHATVECPARQVGSLRSCSGRSESERVARNVQLRAVSGHPWRNKSDIKYPEGQAVGWLAHCQSLSVFESAFRHLQYCTELDIYLNFGF